MQVEKYIDGQRVKPTDQFKMELKAGSPLTVAAEATTAGTNSGLQTQKVGPVPATRGATLTLTETVETVNATTGAWSTTGMGAYAASHSCTVDGAPLATTPGGTDKSFTMTMPAAGQDAVCRFTNKPLTAKVTMTKYMADMNGLNPQPSPNWNNLGLTATATAGTVTKDPTGNTQITNAQGQASWTLAFDAATSRATVNVSETIPTTPAPGYEFLSGSCTVTKADGSAVTTKLTGPAATALTGIAPTDKVDCSYTNRVKQTGKAAWFKASTTAPTTPLAGSGWELTGSERRELDRPRRARLRRGQRDRLRQLPGQGLPGRLLQP